MKSKKGEKLIILLIILAGLTVRLYKLNSPLADWHSFRQVDTSSVARLYSQNGINLLYPKYHDISRVQSGIFNPQGYRFVEFPLFNALQALAYDMFGFLTLESWGRLLSVLFSMISGIFIFKIGSEFNKFVGIVAMALFFLMPFNIYFSRVVLPEPMAVTFAILSLWFFIKYSRKERMKTIILSALFLSLGVLIKPYVLFYGLPAGIYFLSKSKYKPFVAIKNKDLIIYLIIVFLPFVLWRFWISQFPEGIPFWKWTMNGDGIRFKPAFFYWIFGERIGKLLLGVWGVVPFSVGLMTAIKQKNSLLIYLAIGSFVYLSFFATANVRHDYYQTLIVPVVTLISAYGSYYFVREWKKQSIPILGIFAVLAFLISGFQVKEYYKINHPEIIVAGEALDRIAEKDSLVIAAYNGDTAFLYHTKRRGWPVVELPIEELINEGAQYYASVNLNDKQTIEFENRFQTIEKTDSYLILKLK